jgi:hypothetical protein
VHGPLGASYWSVQSAPGEPELVHQ